MTPLSLRIARLLLAAAAAGAVGCIAVIASRSGDVRGALPLLALFLFSAVAFAGGLLSLERDPQRGRLLAAAGAFVLSGVGVLAGFGAGDVTFPAAGLGVLAAWAALLHPPRRPTAIAFLAYVAVGLALTLPRLGVALAYPWQLATVFIWPMQALLRVGPAIILLLYVPIAVGVVFAIVAALPQTRERPARIGPAALFVVALALIGGGATVAIFVGLAYASPGTSLRFELDPLVLASLFIAGALAAGGGLMLRLWRTALSAIALGLGATMLFFLFTYSPAVTCLRGGTSTSIPLAWTLRGAASGPVEGSGGGMNGGAMTGRLTMGDRSFEYRCEQDRVVEYRESD